MDKLTWAEKEIELLKNSSNEKDPYIDSCIDGTLKAFKALIDTNLTGSQWGIAASILNRLINNLPLTPITEKDFEGVEPLNYNDKTVIQCPRMSSLFKSIDEKGNVKYFDTNRVIGIDEKNNYYTSNFLSTLIDEKYPLTLPYIGEKYYIATEEYYEDKEGNISKDQGITNRLKINKIIFPDGHIENKEEVYEV